jgi:acetyltransferase
MLRPADAALYPDFLADVTPQDMRLRFLGGVAHLSPETIARLTNFDPARAGAFAAVAEDTGKLLGVGRLHLDDEREAEYAVLVRSPLKGHGLGWLLMQQLIDSARRLGLQRMTGRVLVGNSTMLQMCRELGFRVTHEPGERGVRRVTLELR